MTLCDGCRHESTRRLHKAANNRVLAVGVRVGALENSVDCGCVEALTRGNGEEFSKGLVQQHDVTPASHADIQHNAPRFKGAVVSASRNSLRDIIPFLSWQRGKGRMQKQASTVRTVSQQQERMTPRMRCAGTA